MKILTWTFLAVAICSTGVRAQDWNVDQLAVIAAIDALSETTSLEGRGGEAYGDLLAEGFTRWTVGEASITGRTALIESIHEWWDDGWRVADRRSRIVELTVFGDMAVTRRLVYERYLGPDGESSESNSAVGEVWVRKEGRWRLFRADVQAK